MLHIAIHGYSSTDQAELQALLVQLVVDCGGWILEEKPLSLVAYNLRFEVSLSNIVELYGALQQTGIQFTPVAHRALAEMCLCQQHLSEDDDVQFVSIDLHVGTLAEENMRFRRVVRQHLV